MQTKHSQSSILDIAVSFSLTYTGIQSVSRHIMMSIIICIQIIIWLFWGIVLDFVSSASQCRGLHMLRLESHLHTLTHATSWPRNLSEVFDHQLLTQAGWVTQLDSSLKKLIKQFEAHKNESFRYISW